MRRSTQASHSQMREQTSRRHDGMTIHGLDPKAASFVPSSSNTAPTMPPRNWRRLSNSHDDIPGSSRIRMSNESRNPQFTHNDLPFRSSRFDDTTSAASAGPWVLRAPQLSPRNHSRLPYYHQIGLQLPPFANPPYFTLNTSLPAVTTEDYGIGTPWPDNANSYDLNDGNEQAEEMLRNWRVL